MVKIITRNLKQMTFLAWLRFCVMLLMSAVGCRAETISTITNGETSGSNVDDDDDGACPSDNITNNTTCIPGTRRRPSVVTDDSTGPTASVDEVEEKKASSPSSCSIFMAPSSFKGMSDAVGYGVYTTRDIQEHERILQAVAPDGPSIVVTDFYRDSSERYLASVTYRWIKLWDNYWWARDVGDHVTFEVDHDHVMDFQITFGSLPNHHCLLNSIYHVYPEEEADSERDFGRDAKDYDNRSASKAGKGGGIMPPPYDDSLAKGAGRGAFSYHMGRDFKTSRYIKAGSELFLNYGHCDRFQEERNPEWANLFTSMDQEYERAVVITTALWNVLYYYDGSLMEEYEMLQAKGGSNLATYDGKQLSEIPIASGILYYTGVLQINTEKHDVKTPLSRLIPSTTGELLRIMVPFLLDSEEKEASDQTEMNTKDRYYRLQVDEVKDLAESLERELVLHQRTPEWIEENGICLEHLIPKPSQIEEAGNGAYAQHYIPKGDIVVPAPTLHIFDSKVLQLALKVEDIKNEKHRVPQQLLLNYCFGHSTTPLLLCPVTNAILINHCSDRPGFPCPTKTDHDKNVAMDSKSETDGGVRGGDGPNAKVQWASSSRWGQDAVTTEMWRNMTFAEMAQQPVGERGISLEIVALRDIYPDDEVFIDYGREWEDAWTYHVNHWIQPSNRYSVTELNRRIANNPQQPLEVLVYSDIREIPPQDDHLMTRCVYRTREEQDVNPTYYGEGVPNDWRALYDDDEIMELFGDSGEDFVLDNGYREHKESVYWPCTVYRDGSNDGSTYIVRIHQSSRHEDQPWEIHGFPRFLWDYPQESIRYFPRPYRSDQHLLSAFRHYIGLEDELVPEKWKRSVVTS